MGTEHPDLSLPANSKHADAMLRAEQTRLLYAMLPVSITANAVLALILAGVQYGLVDSDKLFGWLAAMGGAMLARIWLLWAWRRAEPLNNLEIPRWLRRFRINVIATGLIWGAGGLLLVPADNIPHQVYVTFVLAGLSAGAITSLSVDSISVFGFILSALLPIIIFFASMDNPVHLGMGTMIALYMLGIGATSRQTGNSLRENFRLRIKAVESETRLRQMLESSPIAARIVDTANDRVVFANASYINLIESTPEQVLGIIPSRYYADPEEYDDTLDQLRRSGRVINKLIQLRSPQGDWTKWALASYFHVEYQARPAILAWFYDITDRKLMEEEVTHLAYHDTLTGLPNRALFLGRLQQAITIADRDNSRLALLFIDLDKFKPVNDEHGHDIGDLLLKAVAQRIRDSLRISDSVGRLGGDEFVVLLPMIREEKDAVRIAEKIHQALNQPFGIAGLSLEISSSTGVAFYPDHSSNDHQLMKHADTAMYYAKAEGRNNVKVYRPEMKERKA